MAIVFLLKFHDFFSSHVEWVAHGLGLVLCCSDYIVPEYLAACKWFLYHSTKIFLQKVLDTHDFTIVKWRPECCFLATLGANVKQKNAALLRSC